MGESQPQSHGDVVSRENSLELSTTLVCFYEQQQQQKQLLQQQQQQQQQQQINRQPQQFYINENQNCNDEDLDETNWRPHLFFLCCVIRFFDDKSVQVKVINFIK